MEFKFHENLKELRSKKGVTQEQLASHLMISAQAVSKWERNEGYPDITLLPRIALYYGVSVDDLLGVNDIYINGQIEEWEKQTEDLRRQGEIAQIFDLWENAYRQYPNHPMVMAEYMQSNWDVFMLDSTRNRANGETVIELGEKLLSESTKTIARDCVIQLLAYTCSWLGRHDDAKRYAEMASGFHTCQPILLSNVLKGEDALKQRQSVIMDLTDELGRQAICMARSEHYTTEEKIEIYRYALGLYRALFAEGDYGFYSTRMSQYSSALAQLYAQTGDRDACLSCLADALKFAIAHDQTDDHGKKRTSLLANMTVIDRSAISKNYTENECSVRLKSLQNQCYDFLRDNPEFIHIQAKLEKHAK